MSLIGTEHKGAGRAPDIIVSFSYDENVGSWQVRHQLRELGQPQGRSRQLLADRYAHFIVGLRARLQIGPL